MAALTQVEIQEIALKVKTLLAQESQGVGEITVVNSLDGIRSLPALKSVGDDDTVVEAPLSLLKGDIGVTPVITFVVKAVPYGTDPSVAKTGTNEAPTVTISFPLAQNGDKPVWQRSATGIEIKYSREPDSAYKSLFSFADVMPDVSDFSKEGIAILQEPALKAAERLNRLCEHRDEVREGYWWRWNKATGEWYNTGEIAKGNVMFATFEIDPTTGRLTMFTDPEYTGANFELDENGKLQVII